MRQLTQRFTMALTFAVLAAPAAAAIDEIRLRERAVLSASVLYLADVAEIASADREQHERLARLPLMPAPAPGANRFLQQREIADLLAAHGVDLREVRFEGAERVEVSSQAAGWTWDQATTFAAPSIAGNRRAALLAGQVATAGRAALSAEVAERLRGELNRLISSYLESKAIQTDSWQVSCDVPDRHLAAIGAATSSLTCQGGNPPWAGRQRFVVSFRTSQGEKQLPVYAEVTAASRPAAVAVRAIGRGEIITAADVELRSVELLPKSGHRGAMVESLEELFGMEARQAIRAGEVVCSDQVQAPIVVKRGDLISVSSNAGGISVRTTVRAREDGARGDLVQVESLETRERFDARVVGPRAAAVFAQARPAAAPSAPRIETARR